MSGEYSSIAEAISMDAERLAFLDDIESDLTTMKSSHPVEVGRRSATPGRSRGLIRRIGIVAAILAAGASFCALSASAACAGPADNVRPAVPYCGVPNPVPRSHTKSCGLGFYYHD